METLFARKLAIIRASLPPSLCCTDKSSAIMEVFFVWLKNFISISLLMFAEFFFACVFPIGAPRVLYMIQI